MPRKKQSESGDPVLPRNLNLEQFLTRQEVAEWLQISEQTLRCWATSGKGPKFVKVGGRVRYKTTDVREWVASCERNAPVSLV